MFALNLQEAFLGLKILSGRLLQYKLNSHLLQSLIKYVQEGSRLQSQDDMPEEIR
jgi:hypothetical protein